MLYKMSEKLCLQWNDFRENITSSFTHLREDDKFVDVTLACEDGQQIEAHKVVLVSSSPFFRNLLGKNKHPSPLIYMRGVDFKHLSALLDFIYLGEANVVQEEIESFLAVAAELKLKGFSGEAGDEGIGKDSIQTKRKSKNEAKEKKIIASTHMVSNPVEEIDQKPAPPIERTVTVANYDRVDADMERLDEQIDSMIARSDPKSGKPAACKVCGADFKISLTF